MSGARETLAHVSVGDASGPADIFDLRDAIGAAERNIGAVIRAADLAPDDVSQEAIRIFARLPDGRPITGLHLQLEPDGLTFHVTLLAGEMQ